MSHGKSGSVGYRELKMHHRAIRKHQELLGMERAYRACGCLLIDYLGLPKDDFTYEVNGNDKQYAERILDVVMYCGNMGHYNLKGGIRDYGIT